jgi:hypothetical protein
MNEQRSTLGAADTQKKGEKTPGIAFELFNFIMCYCAKIIHTFRDFVAETIRVYRVSLFGLRLLFSDELEQNNL